MGPQQETLLIDTNVFVIDLRYKTDIHYRKNSRFLKSAAERGNGFTTVINLLELCGILSFNLNRKQLFELWHYFSERYKVAVLPPPNMEDSLPSLAIREIFGFLQKQMSFGDALMVATAKKHLPFISGLISWDKDHFTGKFQGPVYTPAEYLEK
jgi:predicted nucleic acid-binding protein